MIVKTILQKIMVNGYILILPILVWNLIFTPKLPEQFKSEDFNSNLPILLHIGENFFRIIVFILPLLGQFTINSQQGKLGLIIYNLGCILYFASWLILIYFPNTIWSKSFWGFASPAYTPIIWLVGISLMINSYYFKVTYTKWHLIIPSFLFSIFHIIHTLLVYLRTH